MKSVLQASLTLLSGAVLVLSGCASNEAQIRETIRKNPQIVFDVIEENPDQFLDVVNRAAQVAQQKQYEKRAAEFKRQQEEDLKNPRKPELQASRALVGSEKQKIVVVEYADFQCPACQMAYEGLKEFKERHVGEVQFYFKNMPLDFHPMAYPAAQYFEAIALQDRAKAGRFYDYVFEHQNDIAKKDFLRTAAQHVGANVARVEKDLNSEQVKKTIETDMSEFKKFGFTGTPVVLINGVAMNGAQRVDELERVLKLTTR